MPEKTTYPVALPSPESAVSAIDETLLAACKEASRTSPRKRIILPLHKQAGATLQRILNGLQPGTYIRPHRHTTDRGESLIVLSGALLFITFRDDGTIDSSFRLAPGTAQFGIDIEGAVWHAFMALEPDTVLFEIKPGPYNAATDKKFAEWAPEEPLLP